MLTRHVLLAALLALASVPAAPSFPAYAQAPAQPHAPLRPDLSGLAAAGDGQIHNRGVSVTHEGGRTVARLDARAGEGGVLLDGVQLADGVIEVDLKGRDVAQRSFLGIAFHFVDWTTYDAVYFRPFNFRAAGDEQRSHAVQYVSQPAWSWPKLRSEHPGRYEAALEPAPDPDEWFHARIVLADSRVEVYVNGAGAPCLVVDDLGEARSGGVALWVGNGSEGAFTDLTVTPADSGFPRLTGPYLGQEAPGAEPVLFAPGIVSTGMYTRDVAMSPDGSEIYFGVLLGRFSVILETRLEDGVWTGPEVAPFSRDARFFNLEPAISPDGKRFMFLSTRVEGDREPGPAEIRSWANQDIWVMDREGDHWGEPYNLGPPVNTGAAEFFPSLTRDGTLYFTRGSDDGRESTIWRSRLCGRSLPDPGEARPGGELDGVSVQRVHRPRRELPHPVHERPGGLVGRERLLRGLPYPGRPLERADQPRRRGEHTGRRRVLPVRLPRREVLLLHVAEAAAGCGHPPRALPELATTLPCPARERESGDLLDGRLVHREAEARDGRASNRPVVVPDPMYRSVRYDPPRSTRTAVTL